MLQEHVIHLTYEAEYPLALDIVENANRIEVVPDLSNFDGLEACFVELPGSGEG